MKTPRRSSCSITDLRGWSVSHLENNCPLHHLVARAWHFAPSRRSLAPTAFPCGVVTAGPLLMRLLGEAAPPSGEPLLGEGVRTARERKTKERLQSSLLAN